MTPQSEVIIRQLEYLKGRVLFINAPADALLNQVGDQVQASIWTWNYSDHLAHLNAQFESHFAVEMPEQTYDQVVIFVPKSKELLDYVLQHVLSRSSLGLQVFLVGEKKGGIERAAKQMLPYGKCLKLDSARHCQMWQMSLAHVPAPKTLHDWIKRYHVKDQHVNLTLCALPGVFSQNRLDVGTAVLLPFLHKVKSGKIADFGCGAGVISCYLAKLNPNNHIYALDVDAFALKSTALSFAENSLPDTQLSLCAVTGIADAAMQLDAIVSNPPFHQGVQTNYVASEDLCRQAKAHLKISGELWIVANRFLNYAQFIEQQFKQVSIQADEKGFKVIHANSK